MTILKLACAALLLTLGPGCNDEKNEPDLGSTPDQGVDRRIEHDAPNPDLGKPDTAPGPVRVLMKTSLGELTLELDQQRAPITVANFLQYLDASFYDGTIFHRVIADFMIQGGGFDESYKQKPTQSPIKNEAGNGLSNLRGTIAMARTTVVDSATAQFFINTVDNPGLDHKDETQAGFGYAVFGKVIQGLETVDKIKDVPTGPKTVGTTTIFAKDCPVTDVVIQSVTRAP